MRPKAERYQRPNPRSVAPAARSIWLSLAGGRGAHHRRARLLRPEAGLDFAYADGRSCIPRCEPCSRRLARLRRSCGSMGVPCPSSRRGDDPDEPCPSGRCAWRCPGLGSPSPTRRHWAGASERVRPRSRTLRDMSYIPTLLAPLDSRLDELATEISTLEDARTTLHTRNLAAAPTAADQQNATPKQGRRPTPQTKRPTSRRPAPDPKPDLTAAPPTGSTPEVAKRRRRAPASTTRKGVVSSLSADGLERLLADAGSGVSAGTIAEQAGVGYSRVLAQLRDLETAGRVRRTGNRRSTRWLLITDEDRIAQRAAELERLVAGRREDRTQRRGRARAS